MPPVNYQDLKPGQRVKITHVVRVGRRSWPVTITGTIRDVNVLMTGLSTERAPDDVVAMPTVHFVKDNGELSSITIDEHVQFETEAAEGSPQR